jgi:ABC-type bacteriocin/lantibiotic exporter with double-glycine peptidase domain
MANPAPAENLRARFPALSRLGRLERRIPFIEQLAITECGMACLAMVLGYHGKDVGREEMRTIMGPGRDGVTARDILNAARHFGLRGRGVRLELEGLKQLPRAAILHWEFKHFVVFDRLAKDGVEIIDPGMGRRRVPMQEFNTSFTGVALLLEPSEGFRPNELRPKGRAAYLAALVGESGEWGRILSMSLALQTLPIALPLLTSSIVDRVIPRGDQHMLLLISVGLGAIILFNLLASFIRAHLLLHLRTVADARLSLDFLEHLIALPYAFFQRRSVGDLLMRLNSNVLIRQVLTSGMLSAIIDGVMLLGYFGLVFFLSPKFGALVLFFGALQVGIFFATRARRRDINAITILRQSKAQSYEVEMFSGIETLKAMGAEGRAQEQWANLFVNSLNASIAEGRLAATVDSVGATLRMAAPLFILLYGALCVLGGEFTLGTMLAINTFALSVFTPLANMVSMGVQLQLLGSHLERIADVRETPLEQDLERVRLAPPLTGRIEVDHVSFRYGPLEPMVLRNVSLKIQPGQLVALVGRSGSGKSTLASLLLGLYPPGDGRILYDGTNLVDLELRSVRRQLGIVTQRAYLFGGSIRTNITLADPDIPFEVVVEACRLAQIHDEIVAMPMGYDTPLMDGGHSLSGGQRQRIALARALLRKPSILLLDEATSALDAITERRVHEALAGLKCTRIVIAHRLSTILHADNIVVMHEGQLAEQGTHAELLARRGLYAELIESQLQGAG